MRHKPSGSIVGPTLVRGCVVGFRAGELEAVRAFIEGADGAEIEKDGVIVRPFEDPVCFGGKVTRCGCLYHLPGLPQLRESYREADVRWLQWPESFAAWEAAGRPLAFVDQPHCRADMAEEMPPGGSAS